MSPPRRRGPGSWGQHFLADARCCERIIEALAPGPGDAVVEIGAGDGALTDRLAPRVGSLLAVEIDARRAARLAARHAGNPRVRLLCADALELLDREEEEIRRLARAPAGARLRVVGNLPYSIATTLIARLLRRGILFSDAVLMVQREVARRLLAPPGGKDYGFLSVQVALRARGRRLFDVGPGAFHPPPRVHATVVALQIPATAGVDPAALRAVERLTQAAFTQRRKTLVNALRAFEPHAGPIEPRLLAALEGMGLPANVRAERLSPVQFLAIARALALI